MQLSAATVEARFINKIAPDNPMEFYRILAEAEERLLQASKSSWTRTKIDLTITDNEIILPDTYSGIVAARIGGVGKSIVWEEAEFYEGGYGEIRVDGCFGLIVDQGIRVTPAENAAPELRERVFKVTDVDQTVVTVLAKYAAREEITNDDFMYCPSAIALKQAMLAIIYEEANDLQKSTEYFKMALFTLSGGEESQRGIARKLFAVKMFGCTKRRYSNFP